MKRGLTNYGDAEFSLFLRKAFIKAMGYSDDALERPIVGITNTYSDFNACHGNVPQLIEAVKRGVMLAGGLPMEFPTISIHESFAHPTSMFLRNLMAMDTEEMIRAQPMDCGGADRRLRQDGAGAADGRGVGRRAGDRAADRPDAGRSPSGRAARRVHRLPPLLGAATAPVEIDAAEIDEVNERLAPTAGTCMVMGTASTMALRRRGAGHDAARCGGDSGGACRPHAHRRGERRARRRARRRAARRPSEIMTADARFENALRRAAGDRRLDQRASIHLDRDRGPRSASRIDLDAFDALGRRDAGAGRPEAVGPALHGGLPLRPAACRAAARARAAARPRCARPSPADARATRSQAATDAPAQTVIRPRSDPINARAASPCCAATSRRAARSSSSRPRRRS